MAKVPLLGVPVRVASMEKVTDRFLSFVGKQRTVAGIRCIFFRLSCSFFLTHVVKFLFLLKQAHVVQKPVLHVQRGFLVGVGMSWGSSIVEV